MALPTVADIESAVTNLFNALKEKQQYVQNARGASRDLMQVASVISKVYQADVAITVTDTTDATLAAFSASTGQLYAALGRAPRLGDVFVAGGAGDTTDNALATAKGGAVVAGDRFAVSNITVPAVVFLGTAVPDFSAVQTEDFDGGIVG